MIMPLVHYTFYIPTASVLVWQSTTYPSRLILSLLLCEDFDFHWISFHGMWTICKVLEVPKHLVGIYILICLIFLSCLPFQ